LDSSITYRYSNYSALTFGDQTVIVVRQMAPLRILVVEDFEPFRRLVVSTLKQRSGSQIIYEVVDGLKAVEKAQELQPDLILLDIQLPKLNGIQAARRIRKVSPHSKILFLTQESSSAIVEECFRLGAQAYLLKSELNHDLLLAVQEILDGKHFASRRLGVSNQQNQMRVPARMAGLKFQSLTAQKIETNHGHQVASYGSDAAFVADFTRFAETALKIGNPVIVIATETHRNALQHALQGRGVDMAVAIRDGTYISLDARETLSTFMVNDWPDSTRVFNGVKELVSKAAQTATNEKPRVAACGEMGPTLLAQGKREAAFQLEHLTDEIAKSCDVDILCGYMVEDIQREENIPFFERISAEHSAAYSL
jgi:DNA-binding NarL/FixJ family response regulator